MASGEQRERPRIDWGKGKQNELTFHMKARQTSLHASLGVSRDQAWAWGGKTDSRLVGKEKPSKRPTKRKRIGGG